MQCYGGIVGWRIQKRDLFYQIIGMKDRIVGVVLEGPVIQVDGIRKILKEDSMNFGFKFNATPAGYMELDKNGKLLEGSIVYVIRSSATSRSATATLRNEASVTAVRAVFNCV